MGNSGGSSKRNDCNVINNYRGAKNHVKMPQIITEAGDDIFYNLLEEGSKNKTKLDKLLENLPEVERQKHIRTYGKK